MRTERSSHVSVLFFPCLLFRGKFGTVYKCKEKSTSLCLAAKFIAVPNRKERKNVEREIEMMNRLQHPKIIQLYDAFEYNKMVCVVLELYVWWTVVHVPIKVNRMLVPQNRWWWTVRSSAGWQVHSYRKSLFSFHATNLRGNGLHSRTQHHPSRLESKLISFPNAICVWHVFLSNSTISPRTFCVWLNQEIESRSLTSVSPVNTIHLQSCRFFLARLSS